MLLISERTVLLSWLAVALFSLSCTFVRSQTVVEIRADARVIADASELQIEVRNGENAVVWTRSLNPQNADFRGYPLEIPVSAKRGDANRRFELRVVALQQRRQNDGVLLTSTLAQNRVRTSFVAGQVARITLWLLTGCRCNVESERCEPDSNDDLVPECVPIEATMLQPDAGLDASDAAFDGSAVDASRLDGAVECAATAHLCDGRCVSRNSPIACGASCTRCPEIAGGAPVCNNDTCGVECAANTPDVCPTTGAAAACVSLDNDRSNCGTCGNTCPQGQLCIARVCSTPPECTVGGNQCTGMTYCSPSTGRCVAGCDGGNNQCASDRMCDVASHSCVCASGRRACGNVCAQCPSGGNITASDCMDSACVVSSCASGYQPSASRSTCVDVDECATNNGGCAGTCSNTVGSFTCSAGTLRWVQVASTGPSARYGHAMVYDSFRQRTVLFGGNSGSGDLGDTWEWNGRSWTQVATTGPLARRLVAMAYDSVRQRTVLFGGLASNTPMADTWEWNGSGWTQRAPAAAPAGRNGHSMAYDSLRQRSVLFGGFDGTFFSPATWEWDGSGWTSRDANGPPGRTGLAMAYDSARQQSVLFGGNNESTYFQDTWTWNGSAWTRAALGGVPGRLGHAMVYDSVRRRVILFAGYNGTVNYSDTLEWNGNEWTTLAVAGPSARLRCAMVYDSQRQRMVLFGGDTSPTSTIAPANDTWELGVQ